MSWIAVGGAALTAVAGYAKSRKDAKDAKKANAAAEGMDKRTIAFQNEEDYYYGQLEKQERQRGLDEFRKFNTVRQFSPGYTQTNAGVVVPTKPDPDGTQSSGSGGGGGSSTLDKISKVDPLGGKLMKKDPIMKKLFG